MIASGPAVNTDYVRPDCADGVQAARVEGLLKENRELRESLEQKNDYIRSKVNQLLDILGTAPLRTEELNAETLVELDPLGIICDSFRHVLSHLHNTNAQLHMAVEETAAVFSAAEVGILVVDGSMRIRSLNSKLKELFLQGMDDKEIVGRTCLDLICGGDEPAEGCTYSQIVRGSCRARLKAWLFRGRIFDVIATPITDRDGSIESIVMVYHDITVQMEAENSLRKLNEELDLRVKERTCLLEAAMREQESFSYSVSHDLRSPLRHINSYAAMLEEDCGESLPQQARPYLRRIRESSQMMGQLIDDLLELSRISRWRLTKVPVDLSCLAAGIADKLQEAEPDRNVAFAIEPSLVVMGDKVLLNQLLENLFSNAWKYTAEREFASIELRRDRVANRDAFLVQDNGVGFDMAYADKLFGAFQRLHGAEYKGNGIGLATVKRIIDRHDGAIWADSKINERASFYFSL